MLPIMQDALRGWTKKTIVKLITFTIENHREKQVANEVVLDINIQPLDFSRVDRKTEYNRAWNWFNLIIMDSTILLNFDDVIIINNIEYRVQGRKDRRVHGFSKYEVISGFQGLFEE